MQTTEPVRPETQPPGWDQQTTTESRLWTTISLSPDRTEMIHATYRYLCVACMTALLGGWIGSHWMAWVKFACSPVGWIVLVLAINAIPAMARNFVRADPKTATMVLAAQGFICGMAIGDLIFIATLLSKGMVGPNLVDQALVITAVIFAAVTGYILTTKKRYSAPTALMTGLFFACGGAIVINLFFLQAGFLGFIILGLIGALGTISLVYSTSVVLNDPDYDTPVYGALSLFAGLFMIFQFVLSILMMFMGGGRSRD